MAARAPLDPVRQATLMGRGQLEAAVRVRGVRDVGRFADHVAERLVALLARRFESVDAGMVGEICDAALSRMIVVNPDVAAGLVGDPERASLRFAEVVYGAIRAGHADNAKLIGEWGFSGFHGWFAVTAAEIVAGFETAAA